MCRPSCGRSSTCCASGPGRPSLASSRRLHTAWGAYRTAFYPTDDYKAIGLAEHERVKMRGGATSGCERVPSGSGDGSRRNATRISAA
ncbi:hypothetical protein CUJ89_23030 [Burkholderia pyrrocinia]|uniref:Uncharacterized protein n=1 Tax=Burkholderia pyrrocinia TaxID=60550 RepID=A0A2Z5N2C0_BURPY|nr:hypothetical protein CUJ89_23030 [Burkholderia pyrrocinia]